VSNRRFQHSDHSPSHPISHMKKLLPALALTVLASFPLSAQSVNGAWITEFDRMIRNEGGTVSSGEKTKARITLEQKGDSVTGTWLVLSDAPNMTSTPRQLKGTIAGNKLKLQTEFQATVNRNGEQETRNITVVYDLSMNGDKLEGTMTNRTGDMEMPPRPFTATREKR
jgi:hypothetical protein